MPRYVYALPLLVHATVSAASEPQARAVLDTLDHITPAVAALHGIRLDNLTAGPRTGLEDPVLTQTLTEPLEVVARYTPLPDLDPDELATADMAAWVTELGSSAALPPGPVTVQHAPSTDGWARIVVGVGNDYYQLDGSDEPGIADGHTRQVTATSVPAPHHALRPEPEPEPEPGPEPGSDR